MDFISWIQIDESDTKSLEGSKYSRFYFVNCLVMLCCLLIEILPLSHCWWATVEIIDNSRGENSPESCNTWLAIQLPAVHVMTCVSSLKITRALWLSDNTELKYYTEMIFIRTYSILLVIENVDFSLWKNTCNPREKIPETCVTRMC